MNKSTIFPDDPYPLTPDPEYFDGTPVRPKLGRHGLGAKVGADDVILPIDVSKIEEGQTVAPLQPGDATQMICRMNSEASSSTVIDDRSMVEFICWGKSHRYFTQDYDRFAPRFRDALISECRIMARQLQGDYALAIDFLEADGSLGAWMTSCVKDFRNLFRDHKPFKPEEFSPLEEELHNYHLALRQGSADDYALLHATGIKLMKVRYRRDYLHSKLREAVKGLIDDAEFGKQSAEQIEDVAFSVLDLYAQVVGAGNPARKAAYQCAFIFVRAGAHSLGETTAGNSNRRALRALGDVLRKQLPGVFSDMLLGYLKKGMPSQGKTPMPGEVFTLEFVKIQVWVVFFSIDFWVFEIERLRGKDKQNPSDAYLKKLAEGGVKQLVSAATAIVGVNVKNSKQDKINEIWLDRLEAGIPAVVNAIYDEVIKLKEMAEQEKRPFYEVLTAEIGWCMVRVVKACALAVAKAPAERKMKEMHVRDAVYYHLTFGSIDLSKGANRQTKPKPAIVMKAGDKVPTTNTPGPDAEGAIGMAKYDSAPSEPTPTDLAPATPPKRADRKQVVSADVDEDVGEPLIPTKTMSEQPIYDANDYENQQSSMAQTADEFNDQMYACNPEDAWNAALDAGVSLEDYYQEE